MAIADTEGDQGSASQVWFSNHTDEASDNTGCAPTDQRQLGKGRNRSRENLDVGSYNAMLFWLFPARGDICVASQREFDAGKDRPIHGRVYSGC